MSVEILKEYLNTNLGKEFLISQVGKSLIQIIKPEPSYIFPLYVSTLVSLYEKCIEENQGIQLKTFNCLVAFSKEEFLKVVYLLKRGIFDVMGFPFHMGELRPKLEYFFSSENQSKMFYTQLGIFDECLTKTEKQMLDYIIIKLDQGVTRKELMENCWNSATVHHKALDVHLFNLRKKIEPIGAKIIFENGKWFLKVEI